jgi:hypothetical protein
MKSGNHASCRKTRDANHVANADEATNAIDAIGAPTVMRARTSTSNRFLKIVLEENFSL